MEAAEAKHTGKEASLQRVIPYRGDSSLMHSNRSFARLQSDLEKVVNSASQKKKLRSKKGII